MGLTEKRAIKEFQETAFLNQVKEINSITGYDLEFDVDWNSLAVEEYGSLYNEGFIKVYFEPLKVAFREITADELGKKSLKETLHKIVIKNEHNFSSPNNAYSFENGALTIDHNPITNITDVTDRTKYLLKFLYAKL